MIGLSAGAPVVASCTSVMPMSGVCVLAGGILVVGMAILVFLFPAVFELFGFLAFGSLEKLKLRYNGLMQPVLIFQNVGSPIKLRLLADF